MKPTIHDTVRLFRTARATSVARDVDGFLENIRQYPGGEHNAMRLLSHFWSHQFDNHYIFPFLLRHCPHVAESLPWSSVPMTSEILKELMDSSHLSKDSLSTIAKNAPTIVRHEAAILSRRSIDTRIRIGFGNTSFAKRTTSLQEFPPVPSEHVTPCRRNITQ
jgi:hypothetical protein